MTQSDNEKSILLYEADIKIWETYYEISFVDVHVKILRNIDKEY